MKIIDFVHIYRGGGDFFMIKTLSEKSKNDLIRLQEHHIERNLKTQLAEYGIVIKLENISRHGFTLEKNKKPKRIKK